MFYKSVLSLVKKIVLAKSSKNEIVEDIRIFPNVEIYNSFIGEYTYLARNSILHNCDLGKFCSIGPNVVIGYGDHPTNHLSTSPTFYSQDFDFSINVKDEYFQGKSRVTIKNDVWIGAGVFVKNGVIIGDGAIVGAHSVVLNDIEPYSINVGAPSRKISFRFEENLVLKLLEIKWWDLPKEIIQANIKLFTSDINLMDRIHEIEKLKSDINKTRQSGSL